MGEYRATIEWQTTASDGDFLKGHYSREHAWTFDGGVVVPASPSPSVVPAPWSKAANVDPEEAYVAALSSCHMLTFLWVAARRGFAVSSYRDEAVGVLTKSERGGKAWVSKVTLAPRIEFSGGRAPSAEELAGLHHAAHDDCFIANSVKTEIVVSTS
ncbi:MAG TPA: OsmC family protein [Kofleriaceae bacterium]|nr:OsmC family protein [Kofleriaceae bacterium]